MIKLTAPKIYADPGLLTVPFRIDGPLRGVQFDLFYNPVALQYSSIGFPVGSGLHNVIAPGHLKVICSHPVQLEETVCQITFNVTASSYLTLSGAVGTDLNTESVVLAVHNGEILTGVDMLINFEWQDNNPATVGVIDATVFQGTQPNPNTGTWTPVGTVAVGTNEIRNHDLAPNQGEVFFYVSFRNTLGAGAPSNVESIQTSLPVAPDSFTITLV